MNGTEIDFVGLGGLSVATVILAFVFRTLWRQDAGWRFLVEQERLAHVAADADAKTARQEAAEARRLADDAERRAARAEAEAHAARLAVADCQSEHAATTARLNRLVAHLTALGLPLPDGS